MILQSLYERYISSTTKQDKGFGEQEIRFIIIIDKNGKFIRLEDAPMTYIVPTRVQRTSNDKAYLFWDNPEYVLGYPETVRSRARLKLFITRVNEICERYPNNPSFNAVRLFYETKQQDELLKKKEYEELLQAKGTLWTSFRLDTEYPENLVACENDLHKYQEEKYYQSLCEQKNGKTIKGRCLVTGEVSDVVVTHNKLEYFSAPLVSFQKLQGYDSYGKTQGLNAPISAEASAGYVEALDDLLHKGNNTNYYLAGITYAFWISHDRDDELIGNYKAATFGSTGTAKTEQKQSIGRKRETRATPPGSKRDKRSRVVLDSLRAVCGDKNAYIDTESEERFYLLAMEPVKGRIAVKLFVEGTIREIFAHTLQHLEDLKIYGREVKRMDDDPAIPSLYALVGALMPAALKADKWPKRPIEALVRSITTGAPYPTDLYTSCLQRIKAERNVSELRAAYIKGYINRDYRYRHHTEENIITMSLNKNQTNKGYLAGRLFAVLECLQQIANSKATITDSYFGNAMTSPAAVFPYLIRLSIHHQKKAKRDQPGFYKECTKQLDEIMALLGGDETPYPTHFTLEEQGFFSLGYYHQKQYHYSSKEEKEAINNNSSSED